jgi:hypothetical protein
VAGSRIVRIGGASAGIGDGTMATPQLIRSGEIDYVMYFPDELPA